MIGSNRKIIQKAAIVCLITAILLSNTALFFLEQENPASEQSLEENNVEGAITDNIPSGERATRADNPYTSLHLHPIYATDNDGGNPDHTNLDEDAPGDGVYEDTGRDTTYSWMECGYDKADIPVGSTINNITFYIGYKCDPNWQISSGHFGIVWSNTSGGFEHEITNYTLSSIDRDDVYIITTDLPTASQLGRGIYIRVSGKDGNGGSWDFLQLDYLYFTINYSIPDIVINEVMFDPIGNDDNSEWVELYNAGGSAVDLTGWNLTDNYGNRFMLSGAGAIPAGGYLVCHIGQPGSNSSTDIYGSVMNKIIIQPNATKGKDNNLNENSINVNYGTETSLTVEYGIKEIRAIIQFNLSNIPTSGIINAFVRLYRYDGNSQNDAVINVHRLTQNWTELGSTWVRYDGANSWSLNGGDYDSLIEDTTTISKLVNRWYSWDITNLTRAWKNGTYSNNGIIFLNNEGSPNENFYSSEYITDQSLIPKLVVYCYNSTLESMLENNDSLMLLDNNDRVIDYIAWGADPGSGDDDAVSAVQWDDGDYIDTSLFLEGRALGRDMDSNDTDQPEDWENATGFADPFGLDRMEFFGPSPGDMNVDPASGGPFITDISANPGTQYLGGHVNITCNVLDLDGVYGVWVNITLPGGGYANDSLEQSPGNQWYYNNTYPILGIHQYKIWANNTNNNWSSSSAFSFIISISKPTLTNSDVSPVLGYIDTWFNFTVSYSHPFDKGPDKITLNLTGSSGGIFDLIEVDSSDTDHTDGKLFYYNVSGLAMDSYSFHFATNDTDGNWTESGSLEFEVLNNGPILTLSQVNPPTGFTGSWYNFSVTYTDLDGHAPGVITVNITNFGIFDMGEVDFSDTDYNDGKTYYYNVSGFQNETFYSFHFAANDTMGNWTETSKIPGPQVLNTPAILLSPDVVPLTGNSSTAFNFTVTYLDLDNNSCDRITLNLSGPSSGVFDLIEIDSSDIDYTDGKLYYHNVSGLAIGSYTFHFAANATNDGWIESSLLGFEVLNRNPGMSIGQIDPSTGFTDTWFNFTTTYTDLDGHSPYNINVNITGVGIYDLIETDSLDIDYSDGKGYYLNVSGFTVGQYSFHFAANDTVGNWTEGGNLGFEVLNRVPILSFDQVEPIIGFNDTWFNFTVKYTDLDDHAPDIITVNITNLSTYQLNEVNSSDIDYIDGKSYYINVSGIPLGTSYTLHFAANDTLGDWAIETMEIDAPDVLVRSATLTVLDEIVEYSDSAFLNATLRGNGTPIAGEDVAFYVDINHDSIYEPGELVGSATTIADGSVSIIYDAYLVPNSYYFVAVYTGSGGFIVEDSEALLTISIKQATLTALNSIVEEGEVTALNATLIDHDGNPVANEHLDLLLDKNQNGIYEGSELIGSITTSASGQASITFTVNLIPGDYGIWARYVGSGNYSVSEVEGILTVQNLANNPPVILGVVPNQVKPEDSLPWTLDLTSFEADVEDSGAELKWYITGIDTSLYSVTGLNSTDDVFTFIPQENAFGNDEVRLCLVDGSDDLDSQILWINITPVNDLPYFDPKPPDLFVHYDDPSIQEDDPAPWNYAFYVHDIETPIEDMVITTSEPTVDSGEGYAIVDGLEVSFHYPESRIGESILVTLTLNDGTDTDQTTIIVNVTSEWIPELVSKIPDIIIEENTTIYKAFDLDDYFTDKDQDSLFFSSGYFYLTVDINLDNTVDITAMGQWTGTELVTFRAKDPTGAIVEDTITVTIVPVNDGPQIADAPDLNVHFDYSYTFDFSPYISDPDNIPSELSLWTSESTDNIWLQQNNNLGIVVNYPVSMNGSTIPVIIFVSDGIDTASQEILITISNNFPPELLYKLPDVSFEEDTFLEDAILLSYYFLDVEGDALYFSNGSTLINVTINEDFNVDFGAPENWHGFEKVTFRATDPTGSIAEDTILIVVVPVNDPPTIDNIPNQEKNEGDQWVLDLSQYIDDVDNEVSELIITVESEAGNGYVILTGNILVFEYPDGVHNDIVTITVSDGDLETQRSFTVSLKSSTPVGPGIWNMIPWPWMLLILLTAAGGAFAFYKKKSKYLVYEAFLIHEKGLPIAHASSVESSELEDVVVSGMFTAVQDFISDAFSGKTQDDGWKLDEMKFGENKILIERTDYLYLAVIFEGNGKKLGNRVRKLLKDINGEYGVHLANWDGDMTQLTGISAAIVPLIPKRSLEQVESEQTSVEDHSEINKGEIQATLPGREYIELIDEGEQEKDIEDGEVAHKEKPGVEEVMEVADKGEQEIDLEDAKEAQEEKPGIEEVEVYECPVCKAQIGAEDTKCSGCGVEFTENDDSESKSSEKIDDKEIKESMEASENNEK